jgi:cell division protein FtsN
MANYPNRKNSPRAVIRSQSRKRFLIGVILAFVGGYALAWFYQPAKFTTWVQSHIEGSKASQRLSDSSLKKAELPKPKFEFYTLLTQEKVSLKPKPSPVAAPIQIPEPEKVAEVVGKKSATVSKYTYLLQLASFQRREDAEQMKASLIMRGFDASITAATQQGGVWHRVVIGPFTARLQAEKIQAEIVRSEHISGIIRRMDA